MIPRPELEHTFGIITQQKNKSGEIELIVDNIAHRREVLPCGYSRTYYISMDHLSLLRFPVVQSLSLAEYDVIDADLNSNEYFFPDDSLEMRECFEIDLELPLFLPKGSPVYISISFDSWSELSLTVNEPKSGITKTATYSILREDENYISGERYIRIIKGDQKSEDKPSLSNPSDLSVKELILDNILSTIKTAFLYGEVHLQYTGKEEVVRMLVKLMEKQTLDELQQELIRKIKEPSTKSRPLASSLFIMSHCLRDPSIQTYHINNDWCGTHKVQEHKEKVTEGGYSHSLTFKPDRIHEKAYGIDLGTTYSAISTLNQMGLPVIIEDYETASVLLASAVYFQEDGQVMVGDIAKEDGVMHPERLMHFFKRWIGRNEDPYRTIYEVDGKEYDPIELSAIVLGRMVQYANAAGEDVKHVVITCPAYFDSAQRDATKQAGIAAGLDVMAVINEPTAAAIDYYIHRNGDQTILVYDLGGGTFDVSLMKLSEKDGVRNVDIINDGEAMLGGCDWDEALFAILQEKYAEIYGELADEELKYEIHGKVEEVKKKLSLPNKESIKLRLEYEGDSFRLEVTRAEFEEATANLVQMTASFLDKMLEKAGLTDDDLDAVLMVGGSTYMPMIKNMLINRFGEKAVFNDPDKAVARGAAIIANNVWEADISVNPYTTLYGAPSSTEVSGYVPECMSVKYTGSEEASL